MNETLGKNGDDDVASIEAAARALVERAAKAGTVLTIGQVARKPLKMGNYDSVVQVRKIVKHV